MRRAAYLPCLVFLGTVALLTLACGSSSTPQRQLESISINPATSDAQNYPNGQVQFTATGTYNTSPMTATLQDATWTAVFNNASTSEVSITSDGVAQCAAGAVGVFSIGAWDVMHTNGATCTVVGPYGEPGCNAVLGKAQLTCP